jgi:RNA polymerase sigma factor (sigma-70 family)
MSDDGLPAFLTVRPRLFGIAYRMLGSAAEAEDVVQDVWVRWQMTNRSLVRDATAFLTTTARRLAINVMQSARSRRETCVGPGLPEPADASADPRLEVERGQALASGVLLLLERLTPAERAAFILREAFDYPYRDIANLLRLEEANARQVVTRARQRVANGRGKPVRGHRLMRSMILRTGWTDSNEEHSSVGTLAVACGRRTPGSGRRSLVTLIQGPRGGSRQGSHHDAGQRCGTCHIDAGQTFL